MSIVQLTSSQRRSGCASPSSQVRRSARRRTASSGRHTPVWAGVVSMAALSDRVGRPAGDTKVPSPGTTLRTTAVKRNADQALRAAALHLPYAYVLDRTGDLWIFKLPEQAGEKPDRRRSTRSTVDGAAAAGGVTPRGPVPPGGSQADIWTPWGGLQRCAACVRPAHSPVSPQWGLKPLTR